MTQGRSILHIDMDAFYASVEQLDNPSLQGKPVIVGGDPSGRGVVSAASYEARRFGVHSAMPMRQALKLCPQAKVMPVRMGRYAHVSQQIQSIFTDYTPLVEPLSLDEAFLDLTGSNKLFGPGSVIGRAIKKRIKEETGLTASVGMASNKFLAKLASDLDKPDGFVVLKADDYQQVLDPLPIRRIWGIGKVTEKTLHQHGFRSIQDLRVSPLSALQSLLGDQAAHLQRLAGGLDDRPVQPMHEAKSISCERTFGADLTDPQQLLTILLEETEQVGARLRQNKLVARTVTLKLRYSDFRTITRSRTLDRPTQVTDTLWRVACELFREWGARSFGALRLVGFGVSGLSLEQGRQLELFSDPTEVRQQKIDRVMDQARARYGPNALHREIG